MWRHAAAGLMCLVAGQALADPPRLSIAPPPAGADPAVSAHATTPNPPPAASAHVTIRGGSHDGFGRLVFDFPAQPHFATTRNGDALVLKFTTRDMIAGLNRPPRNIRAVTGGTGQVEIALAPGAQVHTSIIGGRLILDVLDADEATAAAPGTAPTPARPAAPPAVSRPARVPSTTPRGVQPGTLAQLASPAAAPPPTPNPLPAAPAAALPAQLAAPQPAASQAPAPVTSADAPMPAPRLPVKTETLAQSAASAETPAAMADMPVAVPGSSAMEVVADRAPLPSGTDGAAIALPFAATTGAAAFRRGNVGLVVFDEKRPIDLGELHDDPVFFSALVQLLPNATLLRLALPPERELTLTHSSKGWVVAVVPGPVALQPIQISAANRQVAFAAGSPSQVVTVPDPNTGRNLLVGTQRAAGQGVSIARRTPEFVMLPTFQGVAVEPQSDRPALRATATGFTLTADMPDGLAVSPTDANAIALADAASFTRSFDFTDDTVAALLRRMQSQIASAATAQPLARLAPREEAAQSLISLGMGAEAQALLQLAVTEDPRAAMDPKQIGLSAIGALLAGRMDDATPITDTRLPASDELILWRAVRNARRQEGSAAAAAVFAAEMPLISAYPAALRARLLPLAAETMALGGQPAEAARLLEKRADDPAFGLARGMLAQAQGKTAAALAAYDGVAVSRDQLDGARAALRAAELRLSSGEIGPDKAADAEEKLLYAWRGDGWEVALRRQVAQHRAEAGQWRPALSMLRESADLFPDDRAAIHGQMVDTFASLLHGDQAKRMAPLDLVALVQENADLLPIGPAGEAMAATLADRLQALDLPKRADPVLEKLMQNQNAGAAKAMFGLQLGSLRLAQSDPAGALDALAASASDGQSADLHEQRALLQARATAATGDTAKAVGYLRALGTPAADEARAGVLEAARDWPGATAALLDYVARAVPTAGALDSRQAHILLRLAGAAAQAGNEPVLAQLRRDDGPRIAALDGEQKLAEMFRFLTETPVSTSNDLARAAQETAAVKNLPDAIGKLAHTAAK